MGVGEVEVATTVVAAGNEVVRAFLRASMGWLKLNARSFLRQVCRLQHIYIPCRIFGIIMTTLNNGRR